MWRLQYIMIFVPQVPIWRTEYVQILRDLVKLMAPQKQCLWHLRFIEGFSTDFPIAVMSYGHQITSISVKLTALKRHSYDVSENVYMSVV